MLNDNNYKELLKGVQVIEVSGESCANCLTLMPLLYELCTERQIPLLHLEVAENTVNFIQEYQIDRVPTVLLVNDGVVFAKATGFQPKEIFEIWLDAKLEEFNQTSKK